MRHRESWFSQSAGVVAGILSFCLGCITTAIIQPRSLACINTREAIRGIRHVCHHPAQHGHEDQNLPHFPSLFSEDSGVQDLGNFQPTKTRFNLQSLRLTSPGQIEDACNENEKVQLPPMPPLGDSRIGCCRCHRACIGSTSLPSPVPLEACSKHCST
jgi:hypothetical protein